MTFLRVLTVTLLLAGLIAGCTKPGTASFQPWGRGDANADKWRLSNSEFRPERWGCAPTEVFHAVMSPEGNIRARQDGVAIEVPRSDFDFALVWGPNVNIVKQPGCAEEPFYTSSLTVSARDGVGDGFFGIISVKSRSAYEARGRQARTLAEYADCEVSGRFRLCKGEHVDGMFGSYAAEFVILVDGENTSNAEDLFFSQCSRKWDNCIITLPYKDGIWLLMRYPNTYRDFEKIYQRYQSLVGQVNSYF